MEADGPTPERSAPWPPELDEQGEFQALDEALRAFATAPVAFDAAAAWVQVERGLTAEPRLSRWGRRLVPVAALGLPRRARAFGTAAAAAVVVGLAISLSLLLTNSSAEAGFFEAVEDLHATSGDAFRDGQLTAEEARSLDREAAAVEAALERDPDALREAAPEEIAQALTALSAVRDRLESEGAPASTAPTLATLDRVSDTVSQVLAEGRPPAAPPVPDLPDQAVGPGETPGGVEGPQGEGQGEGPGETPGSSITPPGLDRDEEDTPLVSIVRKRTCPPGSIGRRGTHRPASNVTRKRPPRPRRGGGGRGLRSRERGGGRGSRS